MARPSPEPEDVFVDVPVVGPSEIQQAARAMVSQRDIAILADLDAGVSYRDAARRHDVSVTTVYRLTVKVKTYEQAAKKYFAMRSFGFVDDWSKASEEAAKRGDHRPAKEALLHLRAVEPVQEVAKGGGPSINITIGDGRASLGIPADLPVIDVPGSAE